MKMNRAHIKEDLRQSFTDREMNKWSDEEKQMIEDALDGLSTVENQYEIDHSVSDINAQLARHIRHKQKEKVSSRRKPLYLSNSIIIVIILLLIMIAYIIFYNMN